MSIRAETAGNARAAAPHSGPYEHPWEHVADELRIVDLLVEAGLESMTAPPDDPALDPFRGLVVTEAEARGLLDGGGRFASLDEDRLRFIAAVERHIAARLAATSRRGRELPLQRLARAFGLNAAELRCFLVAAAPDIDRKYEKLYAYLQDDMTCKYATVDLVLRLVCRSESERRETLGRLAPFAPLSALLRREPPDPQRSALARPLRADERIVAYVLGQEWTFAGALASLRLYGPEEEAPELAADEEVGRRLAAGVREASESPALSIFAVHGPGGCGKTLQARRAAAACGRGLLEWDAARAPAEEDAFLDTVSAVLREARLADAIPAFDRLDLMGGDEGAGGSASSWRRLELLVQALTREWRGAVVLMAERPFAPARPPDEAAWFDVPLGVPAAATRQRLWRLAAEGAFGLDEAEAAALAAKFRFTPGRIERTVEAAKRLAAWERGGAADGEEGSPSAGGSPHDAKWLHRAGYMQVRHRLGEKAVKLTPKFGWDDLILPDDAKSLLRQACNRVKYRHIVFGEWGFEKKFAYGNGLSMLFTGPPGTGKTMSAMVMARELDAELYRIDLSRMVSKYIGETEKNLSEVFDEAQLSGAILFFDEADALFGKRSEVKDAHDKYANMETSYLLQKMEEYDGLTILATNFSQNLDEAFTRRIQFIVRFPFPDPEQREMLWRSALPKETPHADDIDFAFLASAFDLAGGPIKNVVLTAAFLAAESGGTIGMKHMLEAVKQEYKKTGKVLLKDRLGAYG